MDILLRIARQGLRHRKYLILAWISLVGANVLALSVPWLIGSAVDHALTENDKGRLYVLAVVLLLLSGIRGLFSYGQTYFAEAASARVAYVLRNSLLGKMHGLSFASLYQRKTGDLMSVATYDVESTRMFISFGLVRFFQLIILLAGVTPLLLVTHWQLGLIGLAGVPLTVYTSANAGRSLRRIWQSVQQRMGELTTVLQENLSGMRVVRSFGAEESEIKKFQAHSLEVAEGFYAANKVRIVNSSFLTFMYAVATALVILFGGWLVIGDSLTTGELTRVLLYLGLLVMPVRMLGMAVNTFSRAISSGERIFQVIDTQSLVKEARHPKKLGRVKGAVSFTNVSFKYTTGTSTLRHVNFEVAPGERVAILGATGSGKTTLVNLISRFYDPTDGVVTIDGGDIKGVTLDSLRRNVGVVFQDIFLFHTTIMNNIAYGAKDAILSEVETAAKAAQLHEYIVGLPEGYNTIVGERGVTLSGGQRQRLAIARTLLLDPPILILDDSTSSVDLETEASIRRALAQVMEGRTTFIIAQRVSSVRGADLILVLNDGEIVERGTHQELIPNAGFYKQIYQHQLMLGERLLHRQTGSSDGNDQLP